MGGFSFQAFGSFWLSEALAGFRGPFSIALLPKRLLFGLGRNPWRLASRLPPLRARQSALAPSQSSPIVCRRSRTPPRNRRVRTINSYSKASSCTAPAPRTVRRSRLHLQLPGGRHAQLRWQVRLPAHKVHLLSHCVITYLVLTCLDLTRPSFICLDLT